MKCKKCGGELVISNGIYICDSCGSQYSVSDYYEDIDACICYVESDDAGRRTKDSVIAQNIYQKLESNKIKSFYARVSADGLLGEQFDRACNAAVVAAKTVIIIGTNKANFVSLVNKYSDLYKGKVIIPVFADMNPYDIPKSISTIQALDYNKVGSEIDLINRILSALGREKEINYIDLTRKSKKKKRIIICVVVSIIVLIVVGGLLFGTHLLQSETSENSTTTATEDPRQSQYSEAMTYIENGKFADAISILSGLSDYKDSNKQLQNIYEKYAGYYKSDDAGLIMHLRVQSGNSASLEVTKNVEGKQVKISESAQFESCKLKCDFNDSENNQGQLNITLNNSDISLTIKTKTVANDKLNMGDLNATFALDEKSDKPFTEKMDAETILGFIKTKTTLGELNQRGIDITFIAPLAKSEKSSKYKINNSDVSLAIFQFDITENATAKVDDPIVYGVSAPASILIPDYVGENNNAFVEDDILYVPDGELIQGPHFLDLGFPDEIEQAAITNESVVGCVCKKTIGAKLFNELVNYYCNSDSTEENSDSSESNSESNLVWLDVGEIVYEKPYPHSGMTYAIETAADYTIVDETYDEYGNHWGKLKSGIGWVYLARTFNEEYGVYSEGGGTS